MNFEWHIERLEKDIKTLKNEYKAAKKFTAQFLNACKNHGIKTVSICKKTDKIKSAKEWTSFGHAGSVFADERENSFPAIWAAVEDVGISGGCGNSGQHQILKADNLIDGVYKYSKGVWAKIE